MMKPGSGGRRSIGWAALAALAAGCGGGDQGDGNRTAPNEAAAAGPAEGETPVLNEDEGAALADEAAADEAADMDAFGGNAAAGETGNASAGEGGAAVPGEAEGNR